jgi:hypothetical protein
MEDVNIVLCREKRKLEETEITHWSGDIIQKKKAPNSF